MQEVCKRPFRPCRIEATVRARQGSPCRPRNADTMTIRRLLASCIVELACAPSASAGSTMFVGAAEDQSRSLDPVLAKARMDLAALAGLDAVRMTSIWEPGQREVTGDDLRALDNAATAAQLD